MKKAIAMFLTVLLVFTLSIPAFAAETGTITINNAVEGQTYYVYKMADLGSYSGSAYSYTPATGWQGFFEANSDYFNLENGYVVLKANLSEVQKVQLAQDALAYAKDNSIAATQSVTAAVAEGADAASAVFTGLDLGWYLVDSSLGAMCGLTTTDPSATVDEKNAAPTVDKTVEEDSKVNDGIDGNEYGDSNDANFDQTINFKTTITVQKGAQNYVLHDKMSSGLTFGTITYVQVGDTDVDAANYTIVYAPAEGAEDAREHNDCTFEITFDNDYIAGLAANTQIVVSYTAKLNENAVIAGEGNPNETWLDYGDNNETTHDFTHTYVYEFDLVKTDSADKLLDGAEFLLYDAVTGGNVIPVVKEADGSYRVAKAGETGETIVVTDGKVTITGLDGGTTYYLEETKAPQGYNKLAGRKEVSIVAGNLSATLSDAKDAYVSGGVQVINKTGAELPTTGGLGTTLFTIVGSVLVIGAGVLLVTKKRMANVAG